MDESTARACLLRAFRERDIAFSQDELISVAKSEEGRAWIEEYLGHENLLTKDELDLYTALKKSGEAAGLADNNDLSIIYPHDDNELKSAIEELQRSTAAIQKQSETLRLQQDAMKSLVKDNRSISEARARADDLQHRKWASERERLSIEIDELSGGLSQRIAEQLQQRKVTNASLNQTTAEFLRADDRLLLSLQKLANELEPEKPEDAELSSRIHNLCARLIKYSVQGIRYRLDRIYLEALQNSQDSSGESDSYDEETRALQEELESLYSEILPVAQMSVEQQYLQPALRMISSNQNQGQDRSAQALEYISKCLTFIHARIDILSTRAHEHISHQKALNHLIKLIQKDLRNPEIPQSTSPTLLRSKSLSSSNPSKQKRGTSSKNRDPKRRSSTSFDNYDSPDPEALLLRALGISLPTATKDSARDQPTTTAALDAILASRLTKLQTHTKALTEASETVISSHIQDGRIALQLLLDSLLSETRFGSVRLVDGEAEEAVGALEGDLVEAGEARGMIDLEELGGRNTGKEEFVGRWRR